MAASLTGAVEKDDGCGYHNGDCPLVHVIVLVEQAATPMTVYVEREKAKMVTLAESRWENSGSISRKEVEPSAEFVELARGVEPLRAVYKTETRGCSSRWRHGQSPCHYWRFIHSAVCFYSALLAANPVSFALFLTPGKKAASRRRNRSAFMVANHLRQKVPGVPPGATPGKGCQLWSRCQSGKGRYRARRKDFQKYLGNTKEPGGRTRLLPQRGFICRRVT